MKTLGERVLSKSTVRSWCKRFTGVAEQRERDPINKKALLKAINKALHEIGASSPKALN